MSLPYTCSLCPPGSVCKATNLLGQAVDLHLLEPALLAAGMYRVYCDTGSDLIDVGGVIDVGDTVINFIPGNVVVNNDVFRDANFKKYVFPALVIGSAFLGLIIIYKLFFRK